MPVALLDVLDVPDRPAELGHRGGPHVFPLDARHCLDLRAAVQLQPGLGRLERLARQPEILGVELLVGLLPAPALPVVAGPSVRVRDRARRNPLGSVYTTVDTTPQL